MGINLLVNTVLSLGIKNHSKNVFAKTRVHFITAYDFFPTVSLILNFLCLILGMCSELIWD